MKKTLKKVLMSIVALVVGGAFGVILGIGMAGVIPENEDFSPGSMVLLVVILLICLWLQIIIHEAGHLVMGLLTGYRFSSFRIGSVMLIRENGRLRFKKFRLPGTGGQCLMSPPDWKSEGIPFAWYNMGGVIFNAATACLGLLCVWIFSGPTWWESFCLAFGFCGIILALMNGIPVKSSTVTNDGYNVRALRRDSGAQRVFWQQMKVAEQQALGVRLKEMPMEWFVWPEDERLSNIYFSTIAVFALNRLMDEMEFEHFLVQYDVLMKPEANNVVPIYRYLLEGEHLYCRLINGEKGLDPSTELKSIWKSMKDNPSVIRQKIAYEKFERRDEAAVQKLMQRFEKACIQYPYQGDVASERELLARIFR